MFNSRPVHQGDSLYLLRSAAVLLSRGKWPRFYPPASRVDSARAWPILNETIFSLDFLFFSRCTLPYVVSNIYNFLASLPPPRSLLSPTAYE